MSNGFQGLVANQPAVGVQGDFADAGIRAVVVAGPGALVTAPSPRRVIVGNFAWGDQRDPGSGVGGLAFSRYYGETTAQIGFVHRENQALIVTFLGVSQLVMEPGREVTLFDQGSFWALFSAGATVGQKVFANYLDGSVYAADAGTSTTKASAMTGSIAVTTGILTVSALTGTLAAGQVLSGGLILPGTAITAQLSGTAGGAGTYQTTATAAVANLTSVVAQDSVETKFFVESPAVVNASITGSLAKTGILTVASVVSGAVAIGQYLTGVGIPASTVIVGAIDSTHWLTNQINLVLTTRAISLAQGQLAKISTWS